MASPQMPPVFECRNPMDWPRVLAGLLFLVLGAVFLAVGTHICYAMLAGPPVGLGPVPPILFLFWMVAGVLLGAALGTGSLVAALYCLLARSGIRLDRAAGTVTVWWNWPGGQRQSVYDLRSFAGVSVREKPEAPVTVFPASVRGERAGPWHQVFLTGPPGPRLPLALVKGPRVSVEEFVTEVASFLP